MLLWWFLIFFKDGERGSICLRCRYAGFPIKRIISCHGIQLKSPSPTPHKTPYIYSLGVLFYIYLSVNLSAIYVHFGPPFLILLLLTAIKIKKALEKTVLYVYELLIFFKDGILWKSVGI